MINSDGLREYCIFAKSDGNYTIYWEVLGKVYFTTRYSSKSTRGGFTNASYLSWEELLSRYSKSPVITAASISDAIELHKLLIGA